jgi:hypothetical protein
LRIDASGRQLPRRIALRHPKIAFARNYPMHISQKPRYKA